MHVSLESKVYLYSSQAAPSSSPWEELLDLWNELKGYREDIKAELEKNPPDWQKIDEDLQKMQSVVTKMDQLAVSNHLDPKRDPFFLQELKEMSEEVSQMEKEAQGKDASGLNATLFSFNILSGIIFQDILQG